MTNIPKLGFVGFGEAAFHLAKGLRGAGIVNIAAFDIHTDTPGLGELIKARASQTQTRLAVSNAELAEASDIVLSTVTANQASEAAQQTAPYLTRHHLYADLNSVSPSLKQAIASTIENSGARFVEVAVMAAVPPNGHRVPMLTGGAAANEFARQMRPFGMKIEVASERIGAASATKMCRSIVIKGMEALLTECVLGATRYEADERVFASLSETLPGIDWKHLANYMVSRIAVHGERRAREMEEVAETLRQIGVEPMMAEATGRRMDWAARLGLRERFGSEGPQCYQEVVDAIASTNVSKT
jgi:3-hydroxyisobutyrate dehydrogenase-like beta-hydroxyacid dehydrogenase